MTIYFMATYWEEPQPHWRADDLAGATGRMKGVAEMNVEMMQQSRRRRRQSDRGSAWQPGRYLDPHLEARSRVHGRVDHRAAGESKTPQHRKEVMTSCHSHRAHNSMNCAVFYASRSSAARPPNTGSPIAIANSATPNDCYTKSPYRRNDCRTRAAAGRFVVKPRFLVGVRCGVR